MNKGPRHPDRFQPLHRAVRLSVWADAGVRLLAAFAPVRSRRRHPYPFRRGTGLITLFVRARLLGERLIVVRPDDDADWGKPHGYWEDEAKRLEAGDMVVEIVPTPENDKGEVGRA